MMISSQSTSINSQMKVKWFAWKFKSRLFFLKSATFKSFTAKTRNSLLSVLMGLLIGFIILWGVWGVNPFFFLWKSFDFAFKSWFLSTTVNLGVVFLFGALAMALCFRSKYFNIGIPGQMLMAGALSNMFLIAMTNYNNVSGGVALHSDHINPHVAMLVAVVIGITSGGLVSVLAGFLKSYLKISEVVSTIMLNFIVYFFTKWLIVDHEKYYSPNEGGSKLYSSHYTFTVGGNEYILPLLLGLVTVVILAVVCAKTTFGYKLKAVGSNANVARYNGINVEMVILQVSFLAGALAGMMGVIYYNTYSQQILYSKVQLPTAGFIVIALALIAYNNIVAIPLVALLWSIVKNGFAVVAFYPLIRISPNFSDMLIGIITCFIAANHLFDHLHFYDQIHSRCLLLLSQSNIMTKARLKRNELKVMLHQTQSDIKLCKKKLKQQVKTVRLASIKASHLSWWQSLIQRYQTSYGVFYQKTLASLWQLKMVVSETLVELKALLAKKDSLKAQISFTRCESYLQYQATGKRLVTTTHRENLNKIASFFLLQSNSYKDKLKQEMCATHRWALIQKNFFTYHDKLKHAIAYEVNAKIIHLNAKHHLRLVYFLSLFLIRMMERWWKWLALAKSLGHVVRFNYNFHKYHNKKDLKQTRVNLKNHFHKTTADLLTQSLTKWKKEVAQYRTNLHSIPNNN